jgi:hypothetical protein
VKITLLLAAVCFLFIYQAHGQSTTPAPAPQTASPAPARRDSDDIEELRADIQQLKTLLNQMRTNLAFVQTSQTPLKHQFELETDAWQVVVGRMERRLKRMEESDSKPAVR